MEKLTAELEQALAEIPVIDMHTHLVGGRLAARGLHYVLLYHMVVTELYAAGCASGRRRTEDPNGRAAEQAPQRRREPLPSRRHNQNTGISWCLRMILAGLSDWREPITEEN